MGRRREMVVVEMVELMEGGGRGRGTLLCVGNYGEREERESVCVCV
jgi:hypothetical protein